MKLIFLETVRRGDFPLFITVEKDAEGTVFIIGPKMNTCEYQDEIKYNVIIGLL